MVVVVVEFWERGRLGYKAERKREESVGKSKKKWRLWRLRRWWWLWQREREWIE